MDIRFFAIQGWKEEESIEMKPIPRILNPSDTRAQSLMDIYLFVPVQPSPCAQYLSLDKGIHIHHCNAVLMVQEQNASKGLSPHTAIPNYCTTITTLGMFINNSWYIVNWHLHSETYPDNFWSCPDCGCVVCSTDISIVSLTISTITNNKSFAVFMLELDNSNCNNPTIHFCYPSTNSDNFDSIFDCSQRRRYSSTTTIDPQQFALYFDNNLTIFLSLCLVLELTILLFFSSF